MTHSRFFAGRLVACAAAGLSLLLIAVGCNREMSKPPPPPPPEVIVQKAAYADVVDTEDFTGRLEAFKRVELQARVSGALKQVHFVEGDRVKKDQLLFEIDPDIYKAELDRAEAGIVQAQARFKRLEGDLQRAAVLVRSRSISKEEYEKIAGDHAEAKAAVGVAEATRDSAKVLYDYTKVKAPFAGRIGRAMVDPGNLVKADATVLATLVTEEPVYAYFDVDAGSDEKLARLAAKGKLPAKMPVFLALGDEDGFPHEGTIDFKDAIVDPATGTRRMRGVFDNKDGLFTPGKFIRVRVQIGPPRKAIVIAEQGVGTDQSQKFVYVVNAKNEVAYRKVKVGMLNKGQRVIEEGLAEGERVIVSGLQKVRVNAKVVPVEEKPPSAKASEITPVVKDGTK